MYSDAAMRVRRDHPLLARLIACPSGGLEPNPISRVASPLARSTLLRLGRRGYNLGGRALSSQEPYRVGAPVSDRWRRRQAPIANTNNPVATSATLCGSGTADTGPPGVPRW